jgi:uncharacterized Tic20 family protein
VIANKEEAEFLVKQAKKVVSHCLHTEWWLMMLLLVIVLLSLFIEAADVAAY